MCKAHFGLYQDELTEYIELVRRANGLVSVVTSVPENTLAVQDEELGKERFKLVSMDNSVPEQVQNITYIKTYNTSIYATYLSKMKEPYVLESLQYVLSKSKGV